LKIPVDAFIYDFEWYTSEPDYRLPSEGVTGFTDFGWNTNLFPNPAGQIHTYHSEGIHFVGIRKPRFGNRVTLAMIRAKGWDLLVKQGENYQTRDISFTNPDLRKWYIKQSADLLQDGIDG
jgi:alpha-glucosidase